jgi:hypothetical protein
MVRSRLLSRFLKASIAAACFTTLGTVNVTAQEAIIFGESEEYETEAGDEEFVEEEPTATFEVQSRVRRAVTPSTKRKPTSSKSVMVSEDESEVVFASDAHGDPESPVPIPDAIADSHEPSHHYEPSEEIYSGDVACDSCDGYSSCGCGCGDSSCGGSCGFSICNPRDCAPPPCLRFANPMVNPGGFTCGILNRMQFRFAAVHFWKTDANLPTLATTDTNVNAVDPGVRGGPTSTGLFGDERFLGDAKTGIRGDVHLWLDDCRQRAVWLRLYDSDVDAAHGSFDSSTTDIITRPFFNEQTGDEDTLLIAHPGNNQIPLREGSLDISLKSVIQGGDLLVRNRLEEDELIRTDFLWGYQKSRFSEALVIESEVTTAPGLFLNEFFQATNQFNGGVLGISRTAQDGCWYFDGFFKLGLGSMNRTVFIDDFGTGGLFANQDTNVGVIEDDTFVMVPEIGFSAGYLLTDNLHFIVGYDFLRLPKVTRAEDALDSNLRVDPRNPPVELRPEFTFTESNLDVHMLDLGLQYRY